MSSLDQDLQEKNYSGIGGIIRQVLEYLPNVLSGFNEVKSTNKHLDKKKLLFLLKRHLKTEWGRCLLIKFYMNDLSNTTKK